MKQKLMILGISLTFLLLISASVNVTPVKAVPTVGVSSGDLLKYKVNNFYVDTVELEISDALNYSGDLSDSVIWVKILDVSTAVLEYWDPLGGNMVTREDPIVDISTGVILASPVTIHTQAGDIDLPAGSGFLFPLLFGTTTRFNITSYPEEVLPLPVLLNNDWSSHEATLNALDGVSVTQTSNEFIIELNIDGEDYVHLGGTITYDKVRAGTLLSATLSITNTSSSAVYVDISIDRISITNSKSHLLVGDQGKLVVDNVDLTYIATGDADSPDFHNVMSNITSLEGKDLFKMTVAKTKGMFYLADLEVYNFTSDAMDPMGQYWFNAFGVFPFGPINVYGEPQEITPETPLEPRETSMLGLFTSPDFDIYASLYQTLGLLTPDTISNFFEFIEDENSDEYSNTTFDSSTSDMVDISIASTVHDSATQLLLTAAIDFDMIVTDIYVDHWIEWINDTTYYEHTNIYKDVTILRGHLEFTLSYLKDDPARFDYLQVKGNLLINDTYFENDTMTGNGQVDFTNIDIKLSAAYDLVQRTTNTSSSNSTETNTTGTTNNTGNDTETSPELALPGMTTAVTLTSLSLIALVAYRKRK